MERQHGTGKQSETERKHRCRVHAMTLGVRPVIGGTVPSGRQFSDRQPVDGL